MSGTFAGSAVLVAGLLAAEAAVGSPIEEDTLRADAFLLSALDELGLHLKAALACVKAFCASSSSALAAGDDTVMTSRSELWLSPSVS